MKKSIWAVCMMCGSWVTLTGCPVYGPDYSDCTYYDPPETAQLMKHEMELESLSFDGRLPASRRSDGEPAGMLKVSFDFDPSSIGAIPPDHVDCSDFRDETRFSGALTIERWSDDQMPSLIEVLVDAERIEFIPYTLDIQDAMALGGEQRIGRYRQKGATHATSYEVIWSYYRGELVLDHIWFEEYGDYIDSPDVFYFTSKNRPE